MTLGETLRDAEDGHREPEAAVRPMLQIHRQQPGHAIRRGGQDDLVGRPPGKHLADRPQRRWLARLPIRVGAQLSQTNQVVGELFAGPIPPLLGGRAGVGRAGPGAAQGAPQDAVPGAGGGGQHEQVEPAGSGGACLLDRRRERLVVKGMVGHDEVTAHLVVLDHGASLSNARPNVSATWRPSPIQSSVAVGRPRRRLVRSRRDGAAEVETQARKGDTVSTTEVREPREALYGS
jgi:hypothetical protein